MPLQNFIKPWYIFFLVLPYGISIGFASVTLPFLLTKQGFSVELAAGITALGFSANVWRFLWGPIADMTFTLKRWYWFGIIACGVTLMILCCIPYEVRTAASLTAIVFISQVAATLVVLPVGGIMAHRVEENKKGQAGGWFEAGNLGGVGLGGGAGLWLATHESVPIAGICLCIAIAASGLIILRVKDVIPDKTKTVTVQVKTMSKDLLSMLKMPVVIFVILVICLPIGTGAASNLFSSIAVDWKVDADTVALVTGLISGLTSALGCIAGGYMADRWGVWWAYFGSGIACSLVTIAIAVFPYSPVVYICGVLVYAFTVGLSYASFAAMTLFAIGKKAAATKYALLSSISNLPIAYMIAFDGWAHDHGGSKYMLVEEAAIGAVAVGCCLFILRWLKQRNLLNKPEEEAMAVVG